MNNQDKEVQKRAAEALTQKGEEITIVVDDRDIWHKLKLKPTKKTFIIRPLSLATLQRISSSLLELGFDMNANNMWEESLKAMNGSSVALAQIIALVIWNKKQLPPRWLFEMIYYNVSPDEMFEILVVVLKQMKVKDFITSIMSVRGMSLTNQGSSIAPGASSEE